MRPFAGGWGASSPLVRLVVPAAEALSAYADQLVADHHQPAAF